ncbi:four helix bundle protein [Paracidobacterium acidisoli]|uniref:Four helix bundle protein n=1 Tax=Paracidobacterium acidisoli TaxID=2303751 RepID=A0A372IPE1_9BACT|nr:four helix bundle protein [Paracidobacterium acidisoli]MBT9331116.1 four helix bundle protein [Paracidobacterium acidisoli]
MRVKQFRDLLVWQKGMALAREIYRVTQSFPKAEVFGLTAQMRRAAVSIPSNIAEGQGRLSDKVFILFLGHARGSLYELETQAELAESLGYLGKQELQQVLSECSELGRMLHGLLNSMREENG